MNLKLIGALVLTALLAVATLRAQDGAKVFRSDPFRTNVTCTADSPTMLLDTAANGVVRYSIHIVNTNATGATVWPGSDTNTVGSYYLRSGGGNITVTHPFCDQRKWWGQVDGKLLVVVDFKPSP